jgi:ectoine hydrolase
LHISLFSREEYLDRIAATKRRMERTGVDLLLVASPENINYLTGYAGWSFYTPQLCVVDAREELPTFITRQMDVACAEFSAFLPEAHLVGYPESYIGTALRHPMEFIGDWLKQRGAATCRIGVEKCAHFFSVLSYEILTARLAGATFVDCDLLVDWVRLVKSPAEIEVMRQAGAIADATMRAAVETIAPGVRECDAAAALYGAQLRGTPEFGGGVPNSVLMPAGAKTRAPHLKWTDAPYVRDQGVNIELSGCRHQYHAALARTVYLGSPDPALTRLAGAVIDGMGAALEAVRPGVPCETVVQAWDQTIGRAGYSKASRIGYSIGLCFQPTWLERTVSLQRGEKAELQANMTFHLMCGMWQGEHNLVMSETFRVSERGFELLTHFPRELIVKP